MTTYLLMLSLFISFTSTDTRKFPKADTGVICVYVHHCKDQTTISSISSQILTNKQFVKLITSLVSYRVIDKFPSSDYECVTIYIIEYEKIVRISH
jgi:hypothetical protein